jgi:tRNA-specific 2-thiouridylase
VHGFYLKIWLEDEMASLGECPWDDDLRYVRDLCDRTDVPLRIIPLQKEYHDRVLAESIEEIRQGRTPNPDVLCNRMIKFGAFFDAIDDTYDSVATGHYAQCERKGGTAWLKMSTDPIKDQTYFLSLLTQKQVSRAMFPVGSFTKGQVRAIAKDLDVAAQDRPESQGLCFLGEIRYDEFVKFHFGEREGDIVEKESGNVLGKHGGYWFYTIGQRKGLDLPGGPWYVVGKDVRSNVVFVSHRLFMHRREREEFEVHRIHWISGPPDTHRLGVKLRHGPRIYDCEYLPLSSESAHIRILKEKDRGIAPGQYAVFYDGPYCLGCAVIGDFTD